MTQHKQGLLFEEKLGLTLGLLWGLILLLAVFSITKFYWIVAGIVFLVVAGYLVVSFFRETRPSS